MLVQVLQKSTVTSTSRHNYLLQLIREKFPLHGYAMLSFGCSTGEEIESLQDIFQENAVQLTGVDVNEDVLSTARKRFGPHAAFLTSVEFLKHSHLTYDLITCFNVLCHHHSGQGSKNEPIAFSVYEKSVLELVQRLKPGGILCIYGSNYCVKDISLPEDFDAVLIEIDSGPVPVYEPDEKTVRVRGTKNVYVIIRKHDEANTEIKQVEIHIKKYQVQELMFPIEVVKKQVTFGLLRPGNQSTNLGDFMQTLAQVHVLATFYNPKTWQCSPIIRNILEKFARLKQTGVNVRQQQHSCDVRVVWVNRDNSVDEYKDHQEEIHVIANGWYMHQENNKFVLPFAKCIRPIFVSVHIAHPEMLEQPEIIDYLKQCGPIGCRDRATHELMQSKNIDSYFSSCLTTTLECEKNQNLNNNEVLEIDTLSCNASHIFYNPDPDVMLNVAYDQLVRYTSCKSIRSTRIHCLLPVRACSEIPELVFCSKTGGQNGSWMERSRFQGLTEVMENGDMREFFAMALYGQLLDCIHDILFGIPTDQCNESDVSDISHQDVVSRSFRDIRLSHPSAIIASIPSVLQEVHVQKMFTQRKNVRKFILRKCPLHAFEAQLDILVTFDQGYIAVFNTFLQHLANSNRSVLLRIWCATRKIQSWPPVVTTPPNVILYHLPLDNYVQFTDYTSPLKHVSEVCLDRILVEKMDFGNANVNRIIYMDLDIAVVGSLIPLLHFDSGEKGIIAKTSIVNNVMNSWIGKYNAKLHYEFKKSFNAGVMVMDIDKLKRNNMYTFCRDLYEKHGVNDQILLNFYCGAQYKELPGQHNIFVGQDDTKYTKFAHLPNSAVAYHYAGSQKPWLVENAADYSIPELHNLWHVYNTANKTVHKHIPG